MTLTNAYLTLDRFALHLGSADELETVLAEAAITAASRAVDDHCHQFFYDAGSATARVFEANADNDGLLDVHPFSTMTGLIVKSDDSDNGTYGTTWTVTTDYIARPHNGRDSTGAVIPWDRIQATGNRRFLGSRYGRPRVEVTARWGWAAVPAEVELAATMLAARLWSRKDSVSGIQGGGDFGIVRVSRYADPDVVALLAKFVKVRGLY